MASLVSTDFAILKGLARLGSRKFPGASVALKVDGGPWGLSAKAAGHARTMLGEIAATSFREAGAAGFYPYPNPIEPNSVVCAPAWRRWPFDQLAFRFGPVSLRLAGLGVAAGIDPPMALDYWHTGDLVVAWRLLVLGWANKPLLDVLSSFPSLRPWFWLGFPDRELPAATQPLDLPSFFRPPLLPFLEVLQPWVEKKWTTVLEGWPQLTTTGRIGVVRAWQAWRDACQTHERPDLVRGMLRAANAACGQTQWIEKVRKQLPAPGSASFQEIGSRETDLLAVGAMLEEMALFRDQVEQVVYIDESYASATAFKLAVPSEVRDRLRQCRTDIEALGVLGRTGGVA